MRASTYLTALGLVIAGCIWWRAMEPPQIIQGPVDPSEREQIFIGTVEDTAFRYDTFVVTTKDRVYRVRGTHVTQGVPPQEGMFCVKNAATANCCLALPPESVIEWHREVK